MSSARCASLDSRTYCTILLHDPLTLLPDVIRSLSRHPSFRNYPCMATFTDLSMLSVFFFIPKIDRSFCFIGASSQDALESLHESILFFNDGCTGKFQEAQGYQRMSISGDILCGKANLLKSAFPHQQHGSSAQVSRAHQPHDLAHVWRCKIRFILPGGYVLLRIGIWSSSTFSLRFPIRT